MKPPIQFLLKVLDGNVDIPFKKEPYNEDTIPCFTFDNTGGTSVLKRSYCHTPYEYVVETKETMVSIHVYTNDVDKDDEVCSRIDDLLFKSLTDHYLFCMNYCKGMCKHFSESKRCLAETNKHRFRSAKGQCPDPELLGYEGALSFYHILRDSVGVEDPFHVDDLEIKTPIIHSVINVNLVYEEWKLVGGLIATDVYYNDREVNYGR